MTAVLLAFLLFPGLAAAQGPAPTPDIPYNFEPVDYESTSPTGLNIGDLIADVSFINALGSYAVTVWAMLDDWAGGGVLGYFVVFLLGLSVIVFIARFVYGKPIRTPAANVSQAAEVAGELDTGSYGDEWAAFGRELNRKKNIRF